ncbi:hypothetical protein CDAR_442431 [Caerostris darwini]|uniref:Uncharacterized protein n=1 Tax=Caerostris darwini TaxID=1538125 RepID=A0AAV4V126_9ARAC|nr:hypothetical protein CDAR_442431 [Caerostris darwini]
MWIYVKTQDLGVGDTMDWMTISCSVVLPDFVQIPGTTSTSIQKRHQKRQEDSRNESSEARQSANIADTTAEESKAEERSWLESNSLSQLQAKRRQLSEQRERKRQRILELHELIKATGTQEQLEMRLENQQVGVRQIRETEIAEARARKLKTIRICHKRARETETPEQRERRLESARVRYKRARAVETPEEHERRLKRRRVRNQRIRESETPEQKMTRQEPIEFDPQPSASADIVIKDEFVVSSEDCHGISADVPSCTEPTSHVTLSVACLGSSQQPDNGQYVQLKEILIAEILLCNYDKYSDVGCPNICKRQRTSSMLSESALGRRCPSESAVGECFNAMP